MKPGTRLQLRQTQKLKLAPQMRQAIQLLQLNRIELRDHLQQMLDANPLLERADDRDPAADAPDTAGTEVEVEVGEDYAFDDLPEGYSIAREAPDYDRFVSDRAEESLTQHLLWQINLAGFSDSDETIARAIVYALDDDGFLLDDIDTLRASLAPEHLVTAGEVEAVLERIQHFEPVGVGSRSIGECLLVQLRAMPADTPVLGLACHLVEHHLDDLGRRDAAQLARATGATSAQVERAMALIRTTSPHPGARFGSEDENYIVPDVFIHPAGDGWRVTLNPDNDPGLKLNDTYVRLAREARGEDKQYLSDRLREARWLLSGLEMRNQTLLAVSQAIVERQHRFLDEGETAMRPLRQRELAASIGVHESTISRATTAKYAHTPRGTLELKRFFSVGIDTSDGNEVSAVAVRAQLRELINTEPPERPRSDQALAEALAADGIPLARRTVAKYREQLGIPPSNARRQRRSA